MAGYVLCFEDYRGLRLILSYHKLLTLLTLQNQQFGLQKIYTWPSDCHNNDSPQLNL